MRRILFRYLIAEQIPAIVLGLFLFLFVLLSSQMLRSVNYLLGVAVPFRMGLEVVLCALPYMLLLTVPMACLLGVLMTFGRLSEQGAIVAMMAGGVSYLRIVSSAFFLGLALSLGLYFWTDAMIPKAYQMRDNLARKMLESLSSIGISEGTFIEKFPGLVIYAKQYEVQTNTLSGVILYRMKDKEIEQTIIAPRGSAKYDGETRFLSIVLENGSLYQMTGKGDLGWHARLGTMKLELDVGAMVEKSLERGIKSFPGMSRSEMREEMARMTRSGQWKTALADWVELNVEYHRRLALPLACVLVAMAGASLGILMGRGRRGYMFILSVGLITAYYFILVGGEELARHEIVSAAMGVWLANGFLLAFAAGCNVWAAKRY
jgi:lipopolysaccharide export system permease protein